MIDLLKAVIFRVDAPWHMVICQFNPKTFSITKQVEWVSRSVDGKNVGEQEFAGGKAQDLSVELWFDTTDIGLDVRLRYLDLLHMAEIDKRKRNPVTRKGEPPECMFQWGAFLSFTGVITSVSQNFVMFKGDGTPLRARVNVTFSETAQKVLGQNPTSRSESRKIWIVHQGESLDWIAYQEYGDPAEWRHIAETNDLDDPSRLKPGQILKLVPLP